MCVCPDVVNTVKKPLFVGKRWELHEVLIEGSISSVLHQAASDLLVLHLIQCQWRELLQRNILMR